MKRQKMKTYKMCGRPDGTCCPKVIVYKNGSVDVMDGDQVVKFTPEQWNELKAKIQTGEL